MIYFGNRGFQFYFQKIFQKIYSIVLCETMQENLNFQVLNRLDDDGSPPNFY
jgi:hypothetical protein